MVPTVFPDNFGGTIISTAVGTNFYLPSGKLKTLRIGFEAELPVYRSSNGIQLENDLKLSVGIQYVL